MTHICDSIIKCFEIKIILKTTFRPFLQDDTSGPDHSFNFKHSKSGKKDYFFLLQLSFILTMKIISILVSCFPPF